MRKIIVAVFFVFSCLTAFGGTKPWPGVTYKTARAYLYNLEEKLMGKHQPVKNGRLDTTALRPGAELNSTQVTDVITLANEKTNLLQLGLSSCYIPHHAIVFFDEEEKPVAWISICFMCDAARFYPEKRTNSNEQSNSIKEKAVKTQLNRLKNMMVDLNLPVYARPEEYLAYHAQLSYPKADSVEIETAGFTSKYVKSYKWAKDAFKAFSNCEADMDSTVKIAAGGRRYYFFGIKNPYSEMRFSKGNSSYLPDYARIHQHCFNEIVRDFPILGQRQVMFDWLKSTNQKIVNTEKFIIKDPDSHLKYTFSYTRDLLIEIAIDMY